MKLIPTRIHGLLDYGIGLLLILAPFLFGFADNGPAMWVPITAGAATLVYSAFTAYEFGLVRALPMPLHLSLDLMSGVLLVASPWLFNFADRVAAPHVTVGLIEIGVVLLSQRQSTYSTPTVPQHL